MSGQGFASLSKQRQKEVASKGGKAARDKGTAHRWNKDASRTAAMKGVAKRKQNVALKAQARLIKLGFEPQYLDKLQLTQDEYVYFGGSRGNERRWQELKSRIEEVKLDVIQNIQIPE